MTIKRQLLQMAGLVGSTRSSHGRSPSTKQSSGFWSELTDILIFQPHKSKTLPLWQDVYRLNREIKAFERDLDRPQRKRTWLTWIADQLRTAWGEFVDEVKALLTVMFFQIVTLVLVIACNVVWFAFLFWVIGLWLEG